MKFKILQAGRYNNALHQADNYAEGETLETGEAYGRLLVESGFAEEIPPEPEPEPEAGETKVSKRSIRQARQGKAPSNPFVPQG